MIEHESIVLICATAVEITRTIIGALPSYLIDSYFFGANITLFTIEHNQNNKQDNVKVEAIDAINQFGADITLTYAAQTDTNVEISGQLEQAVPLGQTYSYELNIINQGPNEAHNVSLWSVAPDSVQLSNFNIQPNFTSGDTLFWIFNQITTSQQIDITLQSELANSVPSTPFQIFS